MADDMVIRRIGTERAGALAPYWGILYIFLVCFFLSQITSCTFLEKSSFIVGEWEWERGTIEIDESHRLSFQLNNGISVFENDTVETADGSETYISLKVLTDNGINAESNKLFPEFDFFKIDENRMLVVSFKPWISQNRYDEIWTVWRKGSERKEINTFECAEEIVLADGHCGAFYIVYEDRSRLTKLCDHCDRIMKVEANGIAKVPGGPCLTQLISPKRQFRYESSNVLLEFRSTERHNSLKELNESDSRRVFHMGFNQEPRNNWNDEYSERIDGNIEYFYVSCPGKE